MGRDKILKEFELFSLGTGGIGSWLTENTDEAIFERLSRIADDPLSKVQFNQLLILGHEAPVSDGFFKYYWITCPQNHTYECDKVPGFERNWIDDTQYIRSLDHLKWGFYRIFTDGLLYFGNVRTAYRKLRNLSFNELTSFFEGYRFNTEAIKSRGPALQMNEIAKDKRYLISEMACKSYGDKADGELKDVLLQAYKKHKNSGGGAITIRELLTGETVKTKYNDRQQEFLFSADEVLDEIIDSQNALDQRYAKVAKDFSNARQAALENTNLYLSMVNELDVYVATSMRTRQDFRKMADACDAIFTHDRIKPMQLRYFDPTLSAAAGHEDKGVIECLMVKSADILIYCAGEKESFGKDAEAAMALSLGKPVIFYCDHEQRSRFYREVHPLSRLIDFKTGVVVGAMVTDSLSEVSELISRLIENKMEYRLEQPNKGYLRLVEALTDSVVRYQTKDPLLTETFWNHYHQT